MTQVALTCSILFMAALVGAATLLRPGLLAGNAFLKEFVNHEIMAFLVVILTITFASVANIHLAISRTQTTIRDAADRARIERQFAKPLQEETRSSAWLLFWSFAVCAVAVLVKGQFPTNQYVVSVSHGVAIIVVFINAAVLYDIYGTIFELVGVKGSEDGNDEGPDFTDESPRTR